MFTFIHAADLHLDSPMQKLENYEGAPVDALRGATRRALENLVELAKSLPADFVVFAGDIFDRDWKDYNTGLFFVHQMSRLKEAGIPVFAIVGNHDAASRMTRRLPYPENVRILSTAAPETVRLEHLPVAIHGQGYNSPKVTQSLVQSYPSRVEGCFNIGLLHTSADGRPGHNPYAPCSLDDMLRHGYDYWALGHVHDREILHENPHVIFPGNIQGRHVKEGGARGCTVVRVDDAGRAEVEFHALDVFRWARLTVDVSGAADGEKAVDRAMAAIERAMEENEGRPLAARVELTGPCAAHEALLADPEHWTNELRAAALGAAGDRVWLEKVRFRTQPDRERTLPEGPLQEVMALLDELKADPDALKELGSDLFGDLARKMPAELRNGNPAPNPEDSDWLKEILDAGRPLLLHRLRGGSGSEVRSASSTEKNLPRPGNAETGGDR
ncbi:MAG: exonuclease SbcCD subunit D [Desulfococcaceae bacterium]